ncbi:hypothetical protein EJ06DRAFT_12391 [Trichodelitschia bisporula]|uniref:Uncharacterized protein n=1 Tax=Trichodelitschia bisporula TaxID=703511 RepID=A0A6G1IAU2_9PEZI|nr:hypothetical protein EJ06DRAFT_12391 [Trichodelitschia bisporula]
MLRKYHTLVSSPPQPCPRRLASNPFHPINAFKKPRAPSLLFPPSSPPLLSQGTQHYNLHPRAHHHPLPASERHRHSKAKQSGSRRGVISAALCARGSNEAATWGAMGPLFAAVGGAATAGDT